MQQRGNLALMPEPLAPWEGGYTNPFTASGVTLQLIMSKVINAAVECSAADSLEQDPVEAEIDRIRVYNELLIYAARVCESSIKQLLHCTQIPAHRYERQALGGLLQSPCPDCRKELGARPHQVSLVGTLAHPFRLCREFEECAMDHMDLVNRLRNSEAAHAGVQTLVVRTAEASKSRLMGESDQLLAGFVHMLSHVSDLEQRMLSDLAEKARAINLLKRNGLQAKDCNFNLVPGQQFSFRKQGFSGPRMTVEDE